MFIFYFFVIGLSADFQIDRDTSSVPYVIVNYRIPYSSLIFQKEDTAFTGEFLTSLVLEKDDYQLGGKSKKNELLVTEYKKTVSDNFYYRDSIKIKVQEGKIKVTLRISDLHSSRVWSRFRELEITELKSTDIGSIRWLSNPSREVITERDTIKIKLNLFSLEEGRTHLKSYFRDEENETYFHSDTVLPDEENQNVEIILPADRFEEGSYDFVAEVRNVNKEETVKESISFRVWEPFFKSDRYVERVRQMEYITTAREENTLLKAPVAKRESLWTEFWEEKDPTPGDRVNEFMTEYFERVDYANRKFSRGSLLEGWRTDRGKTYIILGPPDYIVDEPFNPSGNAYQIWYYYDRGYNLIFVQRYLTGDYDLQNPPPEVW